MRLSFIPALFLAFSPHAASADSYPVLCCKDPCGVEVDQCKDINMDGTCPNGHAHRCETADCCDNPSCTPFSYVGGSENGMDCLLSTSWYKGGPLTKGMCLRHMYNKYNPNGPIHWCGMGDGTIATTSPTSSPTDLPTKNPTRSPTRSPTHSPSDVPSPSPSSSPSLVPTPNPSKVPTRSPSKTPTATPTTAMPSFRPTVTPTTTAPTPKPTTAPSPDSTAKTLGPTAHTGKGHGDPHFVLWSGKKVDFHGACDLVFLSNPEFAHGLGMTIQIRTVIHTWWSYISAAVIRLGDDTLEVRGNQGEDPRYWINGVAGRMEDLQSSGGKLLETIADFGIQYKRVSSKQSKFRIDLGNGDALAIQTFNEIVSVIVNAKTADKFVGSAGMMGSYPSGQMLARDSSTVIEDPIAYGKEWQVLESEPMLFHELEGVQHPQQCAMPTFGVEEGRRQRRRLGEAMVTEEDARDACAHVEEESRDSCIYDVLAINDVAIAEAY